MVDECSTCKKFKVISSPNGVCRVASPCANSYVYNGGEEWNWPEVVNTDWCGQFETGSTSDSCNTCKYFVMDSDPDGWCQKDPPCACDRALGGSSAEPEVIWKWPRTVKTEWCSGWVTSS